MKILNVIWKYRLVILFGILVVLSVFGITLPALTDGGGGPIPFPGSGGS